jgi:Tfp pilus assembly protein PilF
LGEAQKEQGRVMRNAFVKACIAAALCVWPVVATAQCVTVAPNICVTRKSYDVPVNEQPFYGFVAKTKQMLDADAQFIDAIRKNSTLEQGGIQVLSRGWDALQAGDFVTAGRRFNQAYLLNPADGRVYHMYAVLVERRFKDYAYAEELYKIALKLPNASQGVNTDYGRLLLIVNRPRDALPVLEQAVKDRPKSFTAWSNLGFARQQIGDAKGACEAREQALQLNPSQMISDDLEILKQRANCK